MSWKDRLRESIELTSPNGDIFIATWIGNERSKEKKLGIFDFPNFNGSVIQDLGINATKYPLTIYFPGDDNDIESSRFFSSCDQSGLWSITHPLKGDLSLQLVSITEQINPVENGNITTFNTQWIEPVSESFVKSTNQIASQVDNQSINTNASASEQYNSNISLNKSSEIIANEKTIESIVTNVNEDLEILIKADENIFAEIVAITNSIKNSIVTGVLDTISSAGRIQQMIQLPLLATNDIRSRINLYKNMIENNLSLLIQENTSESKNIAGAVEMASGAGLIGICQIIITGELTTRSETISYINSLIEIFDNITNSLDDIQKLFIDDSIDFQYFSNTQSFHEYTKLIGYTIEYLLKSILNLKTEKRFKLKTARSPIEITVSEYGELGVNDVNLDFFIKTNNLTGKEIMILPVNKEVVVYV